MQKPSAPHNEAARLRVLESYAILDTDPEVCFDDLTAIAAHLVGTPIALVSLVDADRQWFKSRYGLDVSQTARDVSFCGHVVASECALVVNNTRTDQRFADNPLVTGQPHVSFYAGVPLRTEDGFVLGTLCTIDRIPREVAPATLNMLERLARQVVAQLQVRRLAIDEARYHAIIDSSADAVLGTDINGLISSWNVGAERIFGYSKAEVLGCSIDSLIPDQHINTEHVNLARIARGESVEHYDTIRRRKSGELINVSVAAAPIKDTRGVIVGTSRVERDTTAQCAQAAALAQSEARLRAVFHTAADPIITISDTGIIESVNGAAERLFGYHTTELVGQNVKVLMPVRERLEHDGYLANYAETGRAKVIGIGREVYARRRDGTTFPVELSVGEMTIGAHKMYTGILRDISARKQAERHLERSLLEKQALLREVHHRVKNNLQLVSSLINLQVRKLRSHATANIQPLLDCRSRVETIALIHEQLYQTKDYGRIPFREYATTLAQRVLNAAAQSAIALDIRVDDFALSVEQGIPCGILLNELLTNSAKHAFPNGGSGTVKVEITQNPQGIVEIWQSDTGVGLPWDFELQQDATLGLQLIRTLVAQLEGSLEIGSGLGTAFHIRFNAHRAEGEEAP